MFVCVCVCVCVLVCLCACVGECWCLCVGFGCVAGSFVQVVNDTTTTMNKNKTTQKLFVTDMSNDQLAFPKKERVVSSGTQFFPMSRRDWR